MKKRSLILGAFLFFALQSPQLLWGDFEAFDQKLFPVKDKVEKQFYFWHDIFFKYSSTSYVIYDSENPDKVLEVIDFKALVQEGRWLFLPIPKEQRRFAYRRFKELSRDPTNKNRKLRIQQGISDNFFSAAKRARPYMLLIEKAIRGQDLPVALSRIPFVESRFEASIISKSGASGIWQLMPRTARQFLTIDEMIDERNCFIKSTFAAAKLLKSYFGKLRSWPLAISSYNHGITGIYKISRKLGTKDFNSILESYQSPRFQYASKNFYAEVMAAEAVYQKLLFLKLLGKPKDPHHISMVLLKKKLSLEDLILSYEITEEEIKKYNKSFRSEAFTIYRKRKLPYDFKLILSTATAARVKSSNSIIPVDL